MSSCAVPLAKKQGASPRKKTARPRRAPSIPGPKRRACDSKRAGHLALGLCPSQCPITKAWPHRDLLTHRCHLVGKALPFAPEHQAQASEAPSLAPPRRLSLSNVRRDHPKLALAAQVLQLRCRAPRDGDFEDAPSRCSATGGGKNLSLSRLGDEVRLLG